MKIKILMLLGIVINGLKSDLEITYHRVPVQYHINLDSDYWFRGKTPNSIYKQ
jgi:hypothetical protein